MRSLSSSPIFLVGTDRSGIGLLGELLDAHPKVSISRRTNFFSFFFERFGDLSEPGNLERCMAAMLSYRRIRDLEPNAEELRRRFAEGDQTYGRLYALIQEQHLERVGKSRWGDKSLNNERHAETILATYPSARVLHVIRDPRDRYASQANHRSASRGGVGAATALWKWSSRLADENSARYPERYITLRYETLVYEPERTLASVCTFIGEAYVPAMLAGAAADTSPTPSTLRTESIGRFAEDLSANEIAFIQLWAKDEMRSSGYETVTPELSSRQRLSFGFGYLPTHILMMWLWRLHSAFNELRGPKPSKRRTFDDPDA